ncbi:MAG: VOC family protein [Marinosulfonomonas sp.]|nr:VOC family protein [Marinosulfonomonas sp.]
MIFRYTILYVQNVETTLAFFGAAFGFKTAFLHEGKDYGELDTGETKLAFSSIALMQQLGKSPATNPVTNPAFEIAFETDDVAAALDKALKAGAELVQEVQEVPWGQTTAYVRLPEGILIEICTAVQAP